MKEITMSILRSVFLMGLVATTVYSKECPAEEDMYPCSCEEQTADGSQVPSSIVVTCDKPLRKFHQLTYVMNALRSKSNVQLNFKGINLGRLPSNLFYGIEVKSLNIHDCELDSLTDRDDRRPFYGLEDILEELKISYSFSEKNMPVNMKMDHMKKLKTMVLSYNKIRRMNREWFQNGPESLEVVIISNNHIDEFQDNTFERLINLKMLFFEGNLCGVQNTVLKWNMLPNKAHKLGEVRFDFNCIEGLPWESFQNMPGLKKISLRYNRLKRLEERPWKDIWERVDEIHLEGNPLECNSHMNWIMSLKTTDRIYGKCAGTGESLRDFIQRKGYY